MNSQTLKRLLCEWRVVITLAAALGAGALLTTATAQEKPSKRNERNQAKTALTGPASTPAAASGLRVFIDPATGKIREPEQEELQALSNLEAAPTRLSSVSQFVLSNGAVGAQVDPSLWSYSVATTGPNGKVSMECVNGLQNAEAKVHAPLPKTGTPAAKEALDVQ